MIALSAEQSSSGGVRVLTLSHTPTEIEAGVEGVVELDPDLVLGGEQDPTGDAWFGAVADVAAFEDGAFAVFDRVRRQILMFDSTGVVTAVHGGEGEAPGEYRHPYALESVGDNLVALDGGAATALTVLRRDGRVRGTGQRLIGGDWNRPTFRSPYIDVEGTQRGTEDATRRLAAYGDSTFLVLVQLSELEDYGRSFPAPPTYLIRKEVEGVLAFSPRSEGEPLAFGPRGAAMRDFTVRHAYTMTRDGDGLFYVHRYALPSLRCARESLTPTPRSRDR